MESLNSVVWYGTNEGANLTVVAKTDRPTYPPTSILNILFWQIMADVMCYTELPVLV